MQNFKFILVSLIVLVFVSFVGYWAFRTIEPGDANVSKEKQRLLEEENKKLAIEVAGLQSKVATLEAEKAKPLQPAPENSELPEFAPEEKPPTTTTSTSSKHQSLINELQKLVDANVYMKEKSAGTRVGTVQTFLNIYFKTSKKIDNDYGAGTKKDVAAFQKAQGLTADGEAGPTTFKKMIEWLKKQ